MDEKKIDYRNKWEKEYRERIVVIAPLGTKANILKSHKSVSGYINKLIADDLNTETIEQIQGKNKGSKLALGQLSEAQKLITSAYNLLISDKVPEQTIKSILRFNIKLEPVENKMPED